MPLFKFVGRGSFITAKQGVIESGGTVDMTDAEAASLPPGTVAPAGIPVPLVKRAEPVLNLDSGRVEKPLLLAAPPPAPTHGTVRPTHSHGSKRVKDTKP